MDFDQAIRILKGLLTEGNPETFNSSWILKHASHCYRFIHKNIRTETGRIDWDKVTYALEKKFQSRWVPGRKPKSPLPYENFEEVKTILDKHHEKLYVFIAPADQNDRRIRDIIIISLVRLAQRGNVTAKQEVIKFVLYTIEDWIEHYDSLSRWQGYYDEIQKHLESCVRRYRYTGSFLNYVFWTLVYSGRGLRPFYAYSLDEPIFPGAKKLKVENAFQDPETQEFHIHKGRQYGICEFLE